MRFESTLTDGAELAGATIRRTDVLHEITGLLAATDAISSIPASGTSVDPVICVDGAVIATQTDLVTWIAVAATNSNETVVEAAGAVCTVGSHTDAVRAAVMAAAELQVAVRSAETAPTVWMDGSLATPLISITTALSAVPATDAAAFTRTLRRLDIGATVGAYVRLAAAGRLRSLPKQDTSKAYVTGWAERVSDLSARWLGLQRDRIVAATVLSPGTFLAPRPAPEVSAVKFGEARVPEMASLTRELQAAMQGWQQVDVYAMYLMPTDLARPIKIEFTTAGGAPDEVSAAAGTIAAQIDPLCHGPRMLEPRTQFVVDVAAKHQVQFVNDQLASEVAGRFAHSRPDLVRTYRT